MVKLKEKDEKFINENFDNANEILALDDLNEVLDEICFFGWKSTALMKMIFQMKKARLPRKCMIVFCSMNKPLVESVWWFYYVHF